MAFFPKSYEEIFVDSITARAGISGNLLILLSKVQTICFLPGVPAYWCCVARRKENKWSRLNFDYEHGLRTPKEEIAFTARPKIQFQIFSYCQSIFCLPHLPNFSDIFDLCLHWVSVFRVTQDKKNTFILKILHSQRN